MLTVRRLVLLVAVCSCGGTSSEDAGPADAPCIAPCESDVGTSYEPDGTESDSTGFASVGGSTGSSSNADEGDDGSSSGDGPNGATFGSGSAFDDVLQMLDYLNEQRHGYLPHDRWRGLPWTGESHQIVTWPVEFVWDDALALEAQLEADALAAGDSPQGSPHTADTLHIPPLYVRGVSTERYVVLGPELPDSWGMSNMSTLGREHGSARQALYYHDPGGAGPVLERVGIGASDAGDGSTWWVLTFE
jgi:hypothetical protein